MKNSFVKSLIVALAVTFCSTFGFAAEPAKDATTPEAVKKEAKEAKKKKKQAAKEAAAAANAVKQPEAAVAAPAVKEGKKQKKEKAPAAPVAAPVAPAAPVTPVAPAAPAGKAEKKQTKPAAKAEKAELQVDLNSATVSELTALGISGADAQKIVAGRPYKNKTQLKTKAQLPVDAYEKIKDKVIAKKAK